MTSLLSRAIPSAEQPFSSSPHGRAAVPQGPWEHLIVIICIIIVIVAAYLCVRLLIQPKEDDRNHIKRKILEDEVSKDRGDNP